MKSFILIHFLVDVLLIKTKGFGREYSGKCFFLCTAIDRDILDGIGGNNRFTYLLEHCQVYVLQGLL